MNHYTAEIHDLGGFSVRRALPNPKHDLIGPFVFFDHFGPVTFPPGKGIDVRPHPHIGIATVTYLFEGQIIHRDSLGNTGAIEPGEVNLMSTGKGMVHSERTAEDVFNNESRLHGIQLWLALPLELEEMEPEFIHYPKQDIPRNREDNVIYSVIMGEAMHLSSPVKTYSPMFYCEVFSTATTTVHLTSPNNDQQGIYIATGSIEFEGHTYQQGDLICSESAQDLHVILTDETRILYFGGQQLEGKRHKHWNFVSSRRERIQQAREDWKAMRFDLIPDDQDDFIPLP
ncbi:pirin family protein [Marinicella sp. W31]|uniref:pirin family protein n=1 Tax=Marinicella sp. W31 TaxID=3023713 RepID=UPI0037579919